MRALPALAVPLFLAACASVNPITLARLAQVDPLTADPAGFEVALRLPPGLRAVPEQTFFTIEGEWQGQTSQGRYLLEMQPGDPPLWRIAPAVLPALRAQQRQIAAWEEADPEGSSGAINIFVAGCRVGDGPAPEDTFDISLRIEAGGPFLPLVRGAAVADLAADPSADQSVAETVAQLPVCAGAM